MDLKEIGETGADKKYSERVFNFKVKKEWTYEVRNWKLKRFTAKVFLLGIPLHSLSLSESGIRIPLKNNAPLFTRFMKYCSEIADKRSQEEKDAGLISFVTFGKLDKGLDAVFSGWGFYVYQWEVKNKEPHLVFTPEREGPSPKRRLEAFLEYYSQKFVNEDVSEEIAKLEPDIKKKLGVVGPTPDSFIVSVLEKGLIETEVKKPLKHSKKKVEVK